VRPPKLLWGPIASKASPGQSSLRWWTFVEVGVCLVFVFGGMFGIGKLLLGQPLEGLVLIAIGGAALGWMYLKVLRKPDEQRVDVKPDVAV
jgi:hypothetical protein